jgi:hypothetical protein
METDASPVIQSIDVATLTGVVRRALGREVSLPAGWQVTRLGGGVGNPVSAGLYRYSGVAQDGDALLSWSVVLKILQSPANVGWKDMGEGEDQSHWNYWKREPLVYRSGLLERLPDGLAAPRFFGGGELPGDVAWLWLEEVQDSYGGAWPLERYTLTARHLGRLNGAYVSERPLPVFPWLGDHLVRQWLADLGDPDRLSWGHPELVARYPSRERNPFRRMLKEAGRFQAALSLLPQVLCHGDTYPTNFMSTRSAEGQERTTALDWALLGIGPLGDDLGQLVFGAQLLLPDTRPEEVTEALFQGYLEGLGDSGCRVDPLWVRFGFTASAALRTGLFQIWIRTDGDEPAAGSLAEAAEATEGDTGERKVPAVADCFEVAMAREAYRLLDRI